MNKQDAIKHIKKSGSISPYNAVLSLYDDDEDIPDEIVQILSEPPRPTEIKMFTSQIIIDLMNQSAMEHYQRVMSQAMGIPSSLLGEKKK